MKKYFLSIVALAGMLFATSCQESLVEPQMEGPTTFTVQLPDQMGTKAIGSKANVNQLLVAVYQEAFDGAKAIHRQTAEVQNGVATISLNLIKGQSYDVIFWAQKDNGYVNVNTEFELVNIPVENKHHNDDNGAAFFFYKENFVPSGVAESVTLKRPFAQLNLGTTAESLITNAGTVAIETSAITVGNVATSFNTVLGYGQGEQTLVFAAKPEPQQELTVGNDDHYVYVSMDYLPISGDDEAVVTVEAQIKLDNQQVVSHKFTNVPVRENYRTNIVGNLISSSSEFTVKVDDSWAGADYIEEYVAPGIRMVNGEYEITSEEGLWSLAEIVNGGTKALTASDFSGKTIKLTCDIDLENEPWTPIGYNAEYQGTFDGQGYTIKNLNVNVPMRGGLFGKAKYATITNLKIDGAVVVSHRQSAAIVGHIYGSVTNCTVNNARITLTAENVGDNKYDNGDKAGALVGLLGESGGKYQITGNTATNIVVTGFRDLGGLVGCAHPCVIKGNEVENITLIKDNTHYYDNNGTPYPDNFGAILGSQRGVGTYGQFEIDYTDEENQEFTRGDIISGSIEEQIKGAQEGAVVAIPAGEYTTLPNPANKITIVCQPGTVFQGTSSLNIKGSTVIGATFKNEKAAVSSHSTVDGIFKNCDFIGQKGLYFSYAGENVVFENCTFVADDYAFHFDGNASGVENTKIICKNCTFNSEWRVAIGSAISQFEAIDCNFNVKGFINMYGKAKLTNCEFIKPVHWIANVEEGIYDNCKYDGRILVGEDLLVESYVVVDGEYFVATEGSLEIALKAKPSKICLAGNITISNDWDNRNNGAKTTSPIEIDGKGYSLKFTGKVSDGFNYHSAFRFEASAEVRNLTMDMSEVAGTGSWLRAISASSNLLIDNCSFIGSENYTKDNAVVIGDSNVTPQIDIKAEITNSEFINWRRGVSDNENAKELREINISDNKFTDANVYVSAYGNIRFDGNEMDNSLINITSYTNAANAKVNAQNNTLDSDLSDYNVIGSSSKKFNAENVNAQDGFVVFTL